MPTVDQVGVMNRALIRANCDGMARWAAIDRVVRAVGRIVVRVDAAAELSTISTSKWTAAVPTALLPKTAPASTEKTSSALSGLLSPMPDDPIPAYAWVAVVTTTYTTSRTTVAV